MRKFLITHVALLSLLVTFGFIACSKVGDPFDEENNIGNNNEQTKEYTPTNIYNKTILLDGGGSKIWGFTSAGKCSVNTTFTLTGTPTYTYTKISSNTASFTWHYIEKDGPVYTTYWDCSQSVKLTFSSNKGGNYDGTLTMKSTGSITSNKTSTIFGTFTLQ